ncbi:MAG: molybdopterin converting factor subunit 1 [Lautropia sp.]|nr:molybdopterin converting factor subunit 1 [Lautropia sp.]
MNIHILYFASLRERLGTGAEQLALPAGVRSVAELRQWLAARGGVWAEAFTPPASGRDRLRAAVDQAMATADTPLHDGAEVAFFPPVTGG